MKKGVFSFATLLFASMGCSHYDVAAQVRSRGLMRYTATPWERLAHLTPNFGISSGVAVPIDIKSSSEILEIDPKKCVFEGRATVQFVTYDTGYPYFDLVPQAKSAMLDDTPITLAESADPDKVTHVRIMNKLVTPAQTHTLTLTFNTGRVKPVCGKDGSVRMFFDMSDFDDDGRGFWENYGPANFEFDQFSFDLGIEVKNSNVDHVLQVNGNSVQAQRNIWHVTFPPHFNSSSFFVHLYPKNYYVTQSETYQGIERNFPITIYGPSPSNVSESMTIARQSIGEYEKAYGPYMHSSFIAYISASYGGGMEFAGATNSAVNALSHEIAHSWYARGVMPASGNAGWIDEAVASWSASHFPQAPNIPERDPVNLANYSPFQRYSVQEAYYDGQEFISELDLLFSKLGGMKKMLGGFYALNKGKVIETSDFQNYLESASNQNLHSLFARNVYGKNEFGETFSNHVNSHRPSQIDVLTPEQRQQ